MSGFDFVFFDLDDTLLDHRYAEGKALADVVTDYPALSAFDIEHVRQTYHEINSVLWKAYGAGEIDRDTLRHRRFARLLDSFGLSDPSPDEIGDVYMDHYARHWIPIDGAIDVLEAVAASVPVGVITNGFAEVQRHKLERFPAIARLLDAVVISEDVGYMKPHPALFEAARRASACSGSILYVGDSFQSDIVGAIESGWSVAWYRRDGVDRQTADGTDQADPSLDRLMASCETPGIVATEFSEWPKLRDFILR